MRRPYSSKHEMNTITLSNDYLWSIRDCLQLGIEAVEKDIKKGKRNGKSKEVIEVFESIKNKYTGMFIAISDIIQETETQFNLDEMMNGIKQTKELMTVLVFNVGKSPRRMEIRNNLNALQDIVKGHIEVIHLDDRTVLICDEESKISGKAFNRPLFDAEGTVRDFIYGDFIIAGFDGIENFESLTEAQIDRWGRRFY